MVEKTSEKFLGKTTKFLGFKREKNGFFFHALPPLEIFLTILRWKKIEAFLGQKSCENHINSDCFQFILKCEESEKYLQLQKKKVLKICSAKNIKVGRKKWYLTSSSLGLG